ncbi:MAG: DUF72 domain-containing protein [Acidobacteria bacterium]|nr:MAG: DUF72 domain-containing protein [Acidobacteriota bacterium]
MCTFMPASETGSGSREACCYSPILHPGKKEANRQIRAHAAMLTLLAALLAYSLMNSSSKIHIGTAGWSYRDWEGVFYPSGMHHRKQHPLDLLAQCFDVVEINTSFYGHIKPHLAKLWTRRATAVNPKFTFTAKLHRSFTHNPLAVMEPTSAASIRPNDEDEQLAREGLEALAGEGRLGALLIQFPVSFKNTSLNREYVEQVARQFIEYPRVVEVRHETWNNPETIDYFTQRNIAFCNIDQPLIGRSMGATEHVTSALGYVRLHGRNYDQWFEAENSHDRYNYLYNEVELTGWKDKIERIARKAEITYVIANNHFEAKGAVNALQLRHMMSGERLKAPEPLLRHYPDLAKIADPVYESGAGSELPLLA